MGTDALSSLIEGSGADAESAVLSRGDGAWYGDGACFGDEVRAFAAALSEYGLTPGARAAVLGPESRGTLHAGLAVIAAGATLVPLEPSLSDDGLRRVLAATGVVQVIASDERQLARVLALRPDLSALELVLLMSAAPSERKPAALLVDAAMTVGLAGLSSDPGLLQRIQTESRGHAACLVVDNSGEILEVGRAMLVSLATALAQISAATPGKSVLVSLPVGGAVRLAASMAALSQGATILLPEPAERPDAGLSQHPADAVLLDVSSLERLYRAWIEDIEAKTWIARGITRWALRQGRNAERSGWRFALADRLALRELRGKLGGRASGLEVVVSAGRRASSEVEAFLAATGLHVRYHSPEADAGATLAR